MTVTSKIMQELEVATEELKIAQQKYNHAKWMADSLTHAQVEADALREKAISEAFRYLIDLPV